MYKKIFLAIIISLFTFFNCTFTDPAFSHPVFGKDAQMVMNPVNKSVFIDVRNYRKTNIELRQQTQGKYISDFEWEDGDRSQTNWVAHPAFGAFTYLYCRAKGYDRLTSSIDSIIQSTLFEYTIEGVIQSPSVHDLVITPGIGIPAGMTIEETSNLLEGRNNGFLHAMSYVVNPMKIVVPTNDKVNLSPLVTRQEVIGFQW